MNKIIELLKNKKTLVFAFLLILVLFILDIYTKRLAFEKVDNIIEKTAGVHNYIRINNYFNIVKVINYGVSFGMFNNIQYGQIILSIITLLIVLYIIYLIYKSNNNYDIYVYSLIVAGGFGNLYDRITYGGVFDFLDFHFNQYHWPAFNLADSLICIGIGLIILKDLIIYIKNKKEK